MEQKNESNSILPGALLILLVAIFTIITIQIKQDCCEAKDENEYINLNSPNYETFFPKNH